MYNVERITDEFSAVNKEYRDISLCHNVSVSLYNKINQKTNEPEKSLTQLYITHYNKSPDSIINELLPMAQAVSQHVYRSIMNTYKYAAKNVLYEIINQPYCYEHTILIDDITFKRGGFLVGCSVILAKLAPLLNEINLLIMQEESMLAHPELRYEDSIEK